MPSKQQKEAEEVWKLFHKRPEVDWIKTLQLKSPFPKKWGYAGRCITTYYSSDKWQKDRKFFERYYHDHKKGIGFWSKGVGIWLPSGTQPWLTDQHPDKKILKNPKAVAVLGFALGFDIIRPDRKTKGKLEPDKGSLLVCAPDKRRLYVLEDDRITALVWGPSLRVESRGIVG